MTYYAGYTYNYHYTGRNQLKDINYQNYAPMIACQYDPAGNRTLRSMYNGTTTDYAPVDALNRSAWVRHTFAGGQTARFDYAFDEMSRLKYEQRNSGTADGYSYDQVGQVTGQIRDGTLSNGTVVGTNLPLSYDGAGNRTNTWGIPSTANNLNEYTTVGGAPVGSDANGNIHTRDGWTYTYDAQNRLRRATDGTKYLDFYYDGLNRQITRGVNNGSGVWKVTFSVWDGWRLLEERGLGDVLQRIYFYGAKTDELVCAFGGTYDNGWFTQDGRGNVSHVFNDSANLVEHYTYGLAGEPQVWDANNNPLSESTIENRFMFQGRDYLKEGAIYDYRNRFYLPTLGRFIQPDPLGFGGDAANLYRYCDNDPVNRRDPSGLTPIIVTGTPIYDNEDKNSGPAAAPPPFSPSGGIQFGGGTQSYFDGKTWEDYRNSTLNTPPGGSQGPNVSVVAGAPATLNFVFNAPISFVLPGAGPTGGNSYYSPPAAETIGDHYDYSLLNHQLHNYGMTHSAQLQSLQQFGNFMTYGVAYPAAGAVAGLTVFEALPVAFESYYGPQYYMRYFGNGLRATWFRTFAQIVTEDAELGVAEPLPPPPPTVATGPAIPGP
jgi:RHS repeat-associated protein